jgi:nitronate monooxygenase
MLRTPLTERLGLEHPIVQAPMGGVAGPELAAAVSAAGGLGMLTAAPADGPDKVTRDAEAMRATSQRFGVGTLAWRLDEEPDLMDAVLAVEPAAVSISAGELAPHHVRVLEAGVPLFVQVSSADGARVAVTAGADFVVAQGTEAGGHTGSVGTLPLLEAVLAAVGDEVPVLAAGGIATGRGLAGVLAMGAAGAWVGTRFAATREALGGDERKERMLAARETDTVHTRVYDIAQGLAWPPAYPGRALRDDFSDRWHGREREIPPAEFDGGHVYAGEAVGAIDDVPAAGELVERLSRQAEEHLRRAV